MTLSDMCNTATVATRSGSKQRPCCAGSMRSMHGPRSASSSPLQLRTSQTDDSFSCLTPGGAQLWTLHSNVTELSSFTPRVTAIGWSISLGAGIRLQDALHRCGILQLDLHCELELSCVHILVFMVGHPSLLLVRISSFFTPSTHGTSLS
jgi:hypothetical protein